MDNAFGGLQVTGNGTNTHFSSATPVELGATGSGVTFSAIAAGPHGDGSVSASASTGRLTLKAGVYRVDLDLSIENNISSGLSSEDATVVDVILAYLSLNGVAISGMQARVGIEEGLAQNVHITGIVEISHAAMVAGTNYISAFLKNAGSAAAGLNSDVIVSEGRLLAQRIG